MTAGFRSQAGAMLERSRALRSSGREGPKGGATVLGAIFMPPRLMSAFASILDWLLRVRGRLAIVALAVVIIRPAV